MIIQEEWSFISEGIPAVEINVILLRIASKMCYIVKMRNYFVDSTRCEKTRDNSDDTTSSAKESTILKKLH